MSGKLFSADFIGKRQSTFHATDDGDGFVIEDKQDIQPVIDQTKESYANIDERAKWGDLGFVGQIPFVIWDQLVREGIAQDDKALLKWLDNPDNQVFRMRPGRLSRGREKKP
jgi:hypothetical protein